MAGKQRIVWTAAAAGILVAMLGSSRLLARRHDDDTDGFPDYNRLEYAKPMAPPDQRPPAPGGIDLKINMEEKSESAPPDAIPVPLVSPKKTADDSEPPLDLSFGESPASSAAAVSVGTSTAPAASSIK